MSTEAVDKWALEEAIYDILAKVALLRATVDHVSAFLRRYNSAANKDDSSHDKTFQKLLAIHYSESGRASRTELTKYTSEELIELATAFCASVNVCLQKWEPPYGQCEKEVIS